MGRGFMWRAFLAVLALVALAAAFLPDATKISVTAPLTGWLAVGAVAYGVHRHRLDRSLQWHVGRPQAWALIGGGLVAIVLANTLRSVLGHSSFPAMGDLLVLPGHALTAGGLMMLIRGRAPGRALDSLLLAAIGAVALAFAAWLLVFEPRLGEELAGHTLSTWRGLLAIALPASSLLVLFLTTRLMQLSEEHPEAYSYLLLALSTLFIVHFAAALGLANGYDYDFARLGGPLVFVYGLWGAAALHPSMATLFEPVAQRASPFGRRQMALLLSAQLLGPALLMVQTVKGARVNVFGVLFGTGLLSALVVFHLVRMVRERSEFEHAAEHDDLTGLPRREPFHRQVDHALAAANQRDGLLAVMFLDLDRFKKINDSLGHAVGNQLLQVVAKRLRRCVRDGDVVGRMGGDEFTVLLPEIKAEDDARIVAQKVRAEFEAPFVIGDRQLFVTASVGVALFPRDGRDPDTLLKNADAAMYRAKDRGRDRIELYTPELNAGANDWLDLESALHRAIGEGQLLLHYQPKVDVESGKVAGVEALVRWRHPELGFIGPDKFIPLAEESGLVAPLGEWVLQTACEQAREWEEMGYRITVSVNVSARQFQLQRIDDMVASALRRTGLDPRLLELELTESLSQNTDSILSTLHAVREMGVKFSIDDFGVGYSSLSYIGTLPIDKIKIDKSFVRRIGTPESAIVVAVIGMGHSLGYEVCAEGVETKEELAFLRRHGCDQIQGYLFSAPIDSEKLTNLLALENLPGEGRLGKLEPVRRRRERPLRPLKELKEGKGAPARR